MSSEATELVAALEALLFAAGDPVPPERLAGVLGCDEAEVAELADALTAELAGRGVHVVRLAGGYSLGTRPEFAEYVQALLQPPTQSLSVQALETLAIIAYRQPITRPEVDALRGCNSAGCIGSLTEKNLVRIAGRKDVPGRPFLLEITDHFLRTFGLNDVTDLPRIEQLEAAYRAAQSQTPDPAAAPSGASREE